MGGPQSDRENHLAGLPTVLGADSVPIAVGRRCTCKAQQSPARLLVYPSKLTEYSVQREDRSTAHTFGLPGAGFTDDQHIRISGSHHADALQYVHRARVFIDLGGGPD
jgi:hypothetical protein